jgi:hypothetical protein
MRVNDILRTLGLVSLAGTLVGGGMAVAMFFICIFGIAGIFVWPYTINTWLVYFGKVAQVLWWHGFLIGLVLGFTKLKYLGIVMALVTWIAMMFLR